jgi:hypothetical protein
MQRELDANGESTTLYLAQTGHRHSAVNNEFGNYT